MEPENGKDDLMLFSAYFDGSGKLHQPTSDHVVLAGVVFYAEHVGDFGPAWADCLKRHSKKAKRPIIRYFHAKDALRCKGAFAKWEPHRVSDLVIELASLIRDKSYALICAPANKITFQALPEKFRRKLQGVNELAFEVCVNELVTHHLGANDHLHIVCDDEEDEAMKVYKFLCRYKLRYPERRKRFAALCFADDEYHPVLQAADLLAYMEREEWDRKLTNDDTPPSPVIQEFSAYGSNQLEYEWKSDEDGLGSAKRLVLVRPSGS